MAALRACARDEKGPWQPATPFTTVLEQMRLSRRFRRRLAGAGQVVQLPGSQASLRRSLHLMRLLEGCMRCPGHAPDTLKACAEATARGWRIRFPPCSHPHDCTSMLHLWAHYCASHRGQLQPAGACGCGFVRCAAAGTGMRLLCAVPVMPPPRPLTPHTCRLAAQRHACCAGTPMH